MRRAGGSAIGLVAGVAADAVLGDPRTGHPVALFGRAAAALERRTYHDSRPAGLLFATACIAAAAGAGAVAEHAARRPFARALLVASATWAVFGAESLRREAAAVGAHLAHNDLPAARRQLTHLAGRDPAGLDADEIARAAVESIAENTCDAVVAPLVWAAIAGVPGLLGYRAVNTLDAMIGHRSPRYARFGWAAARADDVANVVPARLTAGLVAALSGRPSAVARVVQRDARAHPSPNAGWCEAAYAGALDIRLGGTNVYGGRVEERPFLGDGKPVRPADLPRAIALERRVTLVAAALAVLAAAVASGRR